jgi:hypothetical protein
MTLWTVLETIVGGALSGWAMVFGLSRYLGDRLLEGLKAQHGKELAELAHQRSVLLAEMQNAFSMGATSHMACVAFDKHIGFCEEYIDATSKTLQTLIQQGATERPMDVADFFRIRQKWALWLTDDIETVLDRFEYLVTKIASEAPVLDINGAHVSVESSVKSVIADLRKVLATEELTALRNELVVRSLRKPPLVA